MRACIVSLTLCVLIKFAPFNTATNSETTDGIRRSSTFRLSKLPINDFLDTEIQIGLEKTLSLFNFEIVSISRMYHGMSLIFV